MAQSSHNLTDIARSFAGRISGLFRKDKPQPEPDPDTIELACCNPDNTVHIAFRGLSDDRMYVAYNRTFPELRYFRGTGLRAFCAKCRRRVY